MLNLSLRPLLAALLLLAAPLPALAQTGNVGIGTTAPDRPLTVQGAGAASELLSLKTSTGTTRWHWNLSGGGLPSPPRPGTWASAPRPHPAAQCE